MDLKKYLTGEIDSVLNSLPLGEIQANAAERIAEKLIKGGSTNNAFLPRFFVKSSATDEDLKNLQKALDGSPILISPNDSPVIIPIYPCCWISVKDRLPENDQKVLCFNYIGEYKVLRWNYIDWMWNIGNQRLDENYVLYWMPLPEPPAEVKDEP